MSGASWTTVIDLGNWEQSTWRMSFGIMVGNARSAGRLIEGRDEAGAFMACDLDTPWEVAMGPKKEPFVTDQAEAWRALWTTGCIKGWLNDAIDELVPVGVGA